jgi:hypothetical protein
VIAVDGVPFIDSERLEWSLSSLIPRCKRERFNGIRMRPNSGWIDVGCSMIDTARYTNTPPVHTSEERIGPDVIDSTTEFKQEDETQTLLSTLKWDSAEVSPESLGDKEKPGDIAKKDEQPQGSNLPRSGETELEARYPASIRRIITVSLGFIVVAINFDIAALCIIRLALTTSTSLTKVLPSRTISARLLILDGI